MLFKTDLMQILAEKPIVDEMIRILYRQCKDFPAIHQNFLKGIEKLHIQLGDVAKNEIEKYVTALNKVCGSMLFFAGIQGLKMNYEHFMNPMTPNCTWKQIDYNTYLREKTAKTLPFYQSADRYRKSFEAQLPKELKEVTNAVSEFELELECSGMKLAHYYGYIMGNELLHYCLPGYHTDMVLDVNYTHMLETYFDSKLAVSFPDIPTMCSYKQ